MKKIKVGDQVIVLAGKDKKKLGKVKKVDWKSYRVVVEGINVVKKSTKPSQHFPDGGFVQVEKAIHLSNVALVSPKTKKASRIKIERRDGKNIRIAKACGSQL